MGKVKTERVEVGFRPHNALQETVVDVFEILSVFPTPIPTPKSAYYEEPKETHVDLRRKQGVSA